MDKKILFLSILFLNNVTIKPSENTEQLTPVQATIQQKYGIPPSPFSQPQLSELDPTATGDPITQSSSVTPTSSVANSSFATVPETPKSIGLIPTLRIACCCCFAIELFGFDKKRDCCSCCSYCCNKEYREKFFSCCLM